MGSVGTPVILRIVEASSSTIDRAELLAGVGLDPDTSISAWRGETVAEDAYYELLERAALDDDELPLRYASRLRADDLGALGLAVKTAPTVVDGLRRLARYVLVLSDTLGYELVARPGGAVFAIVGRSHQRRGAALANECALGATVSILREVTGRRLSPVSVTFRHRPPASDRAHREFFGCPVVFGADVDGIHLSDEQLGQPTLLGDLGLSRYLLAELDEIKQRTAERSLADAVQAAVTDALPEGPPSRGQIARRLGFSERTLQRRLAEQGESFQTIVTDARRSTAETLLAGSDHPLVEVAYLTGFADQSAFNRAFKRWTGVTPMSFRRANR